MPYKKKGTFCSLHKKIYTAGLLSLLVSSALQAKDSSNFEIGVAFASNYLDRGADDYRTYAEQKHRSYSSFSGAGSIIPFARWETPVPGFYMELEGVFALQGRADQDVDLQTNEAGMECESLVTSDGLCPPLAAKEEVGLGYGVQPGLQGVQDITAELKLVFRGFFIGLTVANRPDLRFFDEDEVVNGPLWLKGGSDRGDGLSGDPSRLYGYANDVINGYIKEQLNAINGSGDSYVPRRKLPKVVYAVNVGFSHRFDL